MARYLAIWFRHLTTDWLTRLRPALASQPVVFAQRNHGRMVITALNELASAKGVTKGMPVADARVLAPSLQVMDESEGLEERLLRTIGLWCLRYTPVSAVDGPDALILDISGCAHLWGGEKPYFKDIILTLQGRGYNVRGAIADNAAAAWGWSRFGRTKPILSPGEHKTAFRALPSAALRLPPETLIRLKRMGLGGVDSILQQPKASLAPRFGKELVERLDLVMDEKKAILGPLRPKEAWMEQLPCFEPVATRKGLEIALTRLLDILCERLKAGGKGMRTAVFRGYRVDGEEQAIEIGTNRPTANASHLFKLFEEKIGDMAPGLGIELFTLTAPSVDDALPGQDQLFSTGSALLSPGFAELMDRLTNRSGIEAVIRYLPRERHWPERSYEAAPSFATEPGSAWANGKRRPVTLFPIPQPVQVTAPVPDYPPMNFRYKGRLHTIVKADGPERIASEWWVETRVHRDYYIVEDDTGQRYWIFRAGNYGDVIPVEWYLHGIFG